MADTMLTAWIAEAVAELGANADPDAVRDLLFLRHGAEIEASEAITNKLAQSGAQDLIEELTANGTITPDMTNAMAADVALRELKRRAGLRGDNLIR